MRQTTLSVAAASLLFFSTARARAESQTSTSVPSSGHLSQDAAGVLIAGATTFGAAYWAALYVGGTSELASDSLLLIPVAGPWLSYARRSPCGETRGPLCSNDKIYRPLIIADGVLQAVGVVLVGVSLLMPRTAPPPEAVPVAAAPSGALRVSLTRVGTGWGLGASAGF